VGGVAERSGVLILRAWVESGEGSSLRIRITGTRDVTGGKGSDISEAASTVGQVCDVIRDWLDELATEPSP
jgi:hypothetical protein